VVPRRIGVPRKKTREGAGPRKREARTTSISNQKSCNLNRTGCSKKSGKERQNLENSTERSRVRTELSTTASNRLLRY